jgi:hypothetical protein
MSTAALESAFEARALADEGYSSVTAPWELILTIRSHVSEIQSSAAESTPAPDWRWTEEELTPGRARQAA